MARTIVALIVLLALVAGGVLLQIFLSKRESRIPGLILPAVSLLLSLVYVFNIAAFSFMGHAEILGTVAMVFFVANIPTIVLLGVYFACREKINRRRQLDKMEIQDL